ncbi:MAG: hypothetical protein EOP67_03575 [Sphingomonas sp.]|nr:MAG: hypothetical protein EOP67_03575 [Sphingomonas sp.]
MRGTLALLLATTVLASAGPAHAQAPGGTNVGTPAGTRAGTPIVNTAGLRYDLGSEGRSTESNTVTIIVAERLDVALTSDRNGTIVVTPAPTVVPMTLTNLDNGDEAFALTATLSPASGAGQSPDAPDTPSMMVLRTLVIDGDGDGLYDAARDPVLEDGRTPVLSPGQSIKLLAIVAATPGSVSSGTPSTATLAVTARSVTGSGSAGTGYAGLGDGGGDALVGRTGAVASVSVPLTTAAAAGATLFKSQSVRAADGSQSAVRDAVITYTLEARFTDAVSGAKIADPIPAGTVFVPGSLTLDGTPLSDGADGDAGRFDPASAQAGSPAAAGIAVALGQVAAASVHTVQFKAKIQ